MLALRNVTTLVVQRREQRLWLNVSKLRGRLCPRTPLPCTGPAQVPPLEMGFIHAKLITLTPTSLAALAQGRILVLAQKDNSPAECRVLCSPAPFGSELLMDDSATDIIQPSDMQECTASLKVDSSLIRFVVGKGGKTKEKIEKETATHLYIPHEVKGGSCLVVKGLSQDKVDEAISMIHCVLQEVVESPSLEYSHFISLPLALQPNLRVQVTRFHDSVMALNLARNNDEAKEASNMSTEKSKNDEVETTAFVMMEKEQAGTEMSLDEEYEQSKEEYIHSDNQENKQEREDDAGLSSLPLKNGLGIEKSILIKPETLHLTVLMLKLWSEERVATAKEVLQGLNSKLLEALNHRPVAVRLKGVECMKGSPAKAHVLYARVEDADQENRLLSACKVIKDAFMEAGLVSEKDKKQELKLHATLMNSSHRKRKRAKRFGKRMPFDARPILSKHGSEEWGEYTVTEAHLSERFVFGEDGYYRCCGSLKFPPALVL